MAYATQSDLEERFGTQELIELTDRTNRPATTIDVSVVTAAIADAEELANSYLAKIYQLPLAPAPSVLTRIVCEIARYFLHGRRTEKDDPVTRAYYDALAWLKDVAKGLITLEADGVPSPQPEGGSITTSAPPRIFSRDSLKGY